MATQKTPRELPTSPRAMRSPSLSSDVPSTRSAATAALPEANPPPSFVAIAEASQLVSSEVDDTVNVKEQALVLLNAFLDHVLYNILSTAKSIQLARLRDAVPVVLKPRLGKAALGAAEEELKEYLNDGDDEVLIGNHLRPELGTNFDLDLAWKLARLRCMVYTRLGDMEEEDEEEHIEAEQLHPGSGAYSHAAHRASSVRAASAIFLTSVLEYLGEQALLYAVQNTQRRAQAPKSTEVLQFDRNGPMSPPIHQSMILDESDMFYVGRESPLSRLWRSWRRQTRLPMDTTSRQISPLHDEHSPMAERTPRIEENTVQEEFQDSGLPHQVPLPISDNDVNEIEVPGLAREIVDDGEVPLAVPVLEHSRKRPASMIFNNFDSAYQPSPESPRTLIVKQNRRSRPFLGHHRSMSHPTPEKQKYSRTSDTSFLDVTNVEGVQNPKGADLQHSTSDITTEAASGDPSVQHAEEEEPEEKPEEKHATSGLVATVVSAAAGALGLGALASARSPKGNGSTEPQSEPVRTAGEKMIGSTTPVQQPTDAVTGPSITNVDDLDNPYIPVEKPEVLETQDSNSRLDSSDPEDLALSSADEDAPEKKPGIPVADSRLLRHGDSIQRSSLPPNSENSRVKAPVLEKSDHSSHISKVTNRQGMVFTTSQKGAKEIAPVIDHEEPDRPLYAPVDRNMTTEAGIGGQTAAVPVASSLPTTVPGLSRNAFFPTEARTEREVAREPLSSRPSTATNTLYGAVPPTLSSDRSGSGNAHRDSQISQYSQDSKRSSSSSKLLGFTRDNEGRPQTGTAYGPVLNGTRSSTEAGRELSSTDWRSAKALSKVGTDASLEKDLHEAEAKKRSLEVLIRSDQTLHYTLTPVSAREEHFPLSGNSPDTTRNLSSRDGLSTGHPAAPANANTINGLRANPVNETAPFSASGTKVAAYEAPVRGVAPLSPTRVNPRTNRAQARDARLGNSTMMDLADYARSTGPENEQQLPKALSSRPGTSTTVKSTSNTIRTMPAPPMPAARPTTQQSQGSKSVGARTRFQAREPTISRKSGTNDLIEFLKEGPPSSGGGVNGNFFNGEGRASAASTQNSSVAPRSVQESMNSSTALLASNRAQQKKVNGASTDRSAATRSTPVPQQDAMPARKQHRVRDPYAIDESDDDLEQPQTSAQAKRAQDESLIDFLRNTAPPPGSSPPPILGASSNAASSAAAAGAVRIHPNNQGIRERIMRSASRSSLNRKASVNQSQPIANKNEPSQYYRDTSQVRDASPHLVQTGKKMDNYKPTTVTHAQHNDRNRSHMKARGPTSTSPTDTADLADYLKNSGPPEIAAGGPVRHPSVLKEEAGFLRFFSRRKAIR